MNREMAIRAKRDEIVFIIISRVAAKLLMMDFKVSPGSAALAAPGIAAQHAFAQLFIIASCEPHRHLLLQKLIHCVSPLTSCANACRCSPGRSWKNRESEFNSTSG